MPVKNTDKAESVGKIKHNFSFQVSDKGGNLCTTYFFDIQWREKKSSNKI
jgi:hypothetical protein